VVGQTCIEVGASQNTQYAVPKLESERTLKGKKRWQIGNRLTDLDCNCANSHNYIQRPPKDVIVGQRWDILPYHIGVLNSSNLGDPAHHSNVGNVDNMAKTPETR